MPRLDQAFPTHSQTLDVKGGKHLMDSDKREAPA